MIKEDNNSSPVQIEVRINADFENVETLDEDTFKNIVLKAFIITAEKLKLDESMGHMVPSKIGANLEFDKSSKTLNFNEFKKEILESYDFLINKNYSKNFLEKYKGRYDLSIDPSIVKKGQVTLAKIFNEIIAERL